MTLDPRLKRGLCLTRIFKNPPAPLTPEWAVERFTPEDGEAIKAQGYTNVQLQIPVDCWLDSPAMLKAAGVVIGQIEDCGLLVVADFWHESKTVRFFEDIIRKPEGALRVISSYTRIADLLADRPNVHLHVLNEAGGRPEQWEDADVDSYNGLITSVAEIVQKSSPGRIIHANPPSWGNYVYWWEPPQIPNLVTRVNAWDPFIRTHAGANWFSGYWEFLRYINGLKWPFAPWNVLDRLSFLRYALSPEQSRAAVNEMWNYRGFPNVKAIRKVARDCRETYGPNTILGEFGCRIAGDPAGRKALLDAYKSAWSHWTEFAEFDGYDWPEGGRLTFRSQAV